MDIFEDIKLFNLKKKQIGFSLNQLIGNGTVEMYDADTRREVKYLLEDLDAISHNWSQHQGEMHDSVGRWVNLCADQARKNKRKKGGSDRAVKGIDLSKSIGDDLLKMSGSISISSIEVEHSMDSLKDWRISSSNIEKLNIIGKGTFGTVYAGTSSGTPVAIKEIYDSQYSEQLLSRECSLMNSLRNPHITEFMGMCLEKDCCMLIMEYCERGSLAKLLYEGKHTLDFMKKISITKGVVSAMEYLHSKDIIHADLKPENILITSDYSVKVSDFGLSSLIGHLKSNAPIGTHSFMAPELFKGNPLTKECDVYSFGNLLLSLFSGERLHKEYQNSSIEEFKQAVIQGIPPKVDVPSYVFELRNRCCHLVPEKRPTFLDLSENNFFDVNRIANLNVGEGSEHLIDLWNINFDSNEVLFSDFLKVFCRELKFAFDSNDYSDFGSPRLRCFKNALGMQEGDSHVKLENYIDFINWFSPISTGSELLAKIYKLYSEPWFHGFLNQYEASSILETYSKSFLVRYGGEGKLSISFKKKGVPPKHIRIPPHTVFREAKEYLKKYKVPKERAHEHLFSTTRGEGYFALDPKLNRKEEKDALEQIAKDEQLEKLPQEDLEYIF
eukprot:TRINITY_DN7095_c0_g1_i1.p1 TRINITY_DN7095_c0_g1~~TRINITY_DN7095_c0_g1_i1.p1  ORF type:complete len:646 (+),score=144.43 TRINITY_DN7095_c0_g1_i1:105-1940(+)